MTASTANPSETSKRIGVLPCLTAFIAGQPMPEIEARVAADRARREEAAAEALSRSHRATWRRMFPGAGWETVDLHHASLDGWRTEAARVLAWDPPREGRGLLLSGADSGRAKTRVCAALLHRLMVHRLVPASLWHAQDLAAEIASRTAFGTDTAKEFIMELAACRLLFIDDLGQETTLRGQEERVEAWLFRLFDRRLQLNLPTLITTNHTNADLVAAATPLRGFPLLRRLAELCEIVRVN